MSTQTQISWDSLGQSEVRTAIRSLINNEAIALTGISTSDFRTLVNGTPVDGVKLNAANLRQIGKAGQYFHSPELMATDSAPTPSPAPVAPAPTPSPAPAAVAPEQAIEALRGLFQPQTPALDVGRVRQEALDVQRDQFGQLFEKQLNEQPEAIEKAIANTVKKFADDSLAATVSALMQTELGESIRGQLASGEKTLLPPIRSVSKYYRPNRTTKRIRSAILARFHVIISGPSGSGKTYPLEQVLNDLGRRWIKISCSEGISMSELVAEKTIEVESGAPVMKTLLKVLPIAAREGIVVIFDEADQLPPELLSAVNSYTDAHPAVVTVPQTGERITAHKDFLVAFTMNGLTDETGLYSGHQISGALKTRCRFVYADYLTKREEVSILQADGLSEQAASDVVDKFSILRKAHTAGTLTMPPSTRTMLSISKALQAKDAYGQEVEALSPMTLDEALKMTILDALTPSEANEVKSLLSI